MAFHNQKCVQLVQGVIMLISITTSLLLFNFEKNISYVFLFLRNFKISFPSVFTVHFVLFQREKRRKNLTINLNKFCLHAVAGFTTHCTNRRGALHTTEKQSLMKYNATISKYIQLIFCYVTQNLSPFNICKN